MHIEDDHDSFIITFDEEEMQPDFLKRLEDRIPILHRKISEDRSQWRIHKKFKNRVLKLVPKKRTTQNHEVEQLSLF